MKTDAWIVLYDFPASSKSGLAQFYRRLRELLAESGGSAQCRATKSAYIVEGPDAMELAYAIAALASRYGAGKVGEQGGVIVLPLGNVPPDMHFNALKRADEIVDALCVDHRVRANKRAPRTVRGIQAMQGAAHVEPTAVAWDDLNQFLSQRMGAKEMAE